MTLEDILNSHRTGRPVVMGILNVTPDSFSDGGRFLDPAAAVRQAERMTAEGADILDVGAESTRPGSDRLPAAEQIRRLRDVLSAVCRTGAIVSIDTTRSEVAAFALQAGAKIVNDVSAGRDDPAMLKLIADRGAAVVLMHMLGQPKSMQAEARYGDVVAEVRDFLAARLAAAEAAAEAAGIGRSRCIVDPGIGFGKRVEHNVALLAGLGELTSLGAAVLIGPSRKRFLGELTGEDVPSRRVAAGVAACVIGYLRGATIFRVHDVAETVAALKVAQAVREAR